MKAKLLILFLFFSIFCYSQDPTFVTKFDVLERDATTAKTYKFTINNNSLAARYVAGNQIQVSVNTATSTLAPANYSISAPQANVTANAGIYDFFITVNPIATYDTERTLNIAYSINPTGAAVNYENTNFLSIRVLSQPDRIKRYSYLAYVGTNFDLVDGVQAKNLFFATNIMAKPENNKRFGFYISLYGNRAISRIDSIPNVVREKEVIDSIGNQYSIKEKSDIVRNIQSDNLGAYSALLVRLSRATNSDTKLYFSPSLEFILRRSTVNVNYVNAKELPPEQLNVLVPSISRNLSYNQKNSYNIYDFNVGVLGFFLNHENDYISVRLNMNTGYSTRYAPMGYYGGVTRLFINTVESQYENKSNIFYTGKLWITDRTTGITLQAEINNTYKDPNPFYGVTLSKAFDFDKLGTIFKPLSTRTSPTP